MTTKLQHSWSDQTLSQSLITAITDDPDIKQGLFPPPGPNASSAKGGGKKKTLWQWKVAVAIFKEHPTYSTAFAAAYNCADPKLKPKLQSSWAWNIRSFRLRDACRMSTITREYMDEMGQTGAGIAREDDIDLTQENSFTSKWGKLVICFKYRCTHDISSDDQGRLPLVL